MFLDTQAQSQPNRRRPQARIPLHRIVSYFHGLPPLRSNHISVNIGDSICGILNRYEILREFIPAHRLANSPRLSSLFVVRDIHNGKEALAKFMPDTLQSNPHSRFHFLKEIEALSQLDLRSVSPLVDAGIDGAGRPFFILDFVPGIPLLHIMRSMPSDLPLVLSISIDVADTLATVHTAGVIHCDLKPGNLMVSHLGGAPLVTVIDFGAAYIRGRTEPPVNFIIGTPSYMAPEQLCAVRSFNPRIDIFALGGDYLSACYRKKSLCS